MPCSPPLTSINGSPRTDVLGGEALNARNIIGIVVFLILLYLLLHLLFRVI